MRRLSRQCYDKFWRCPGWAGGGFRAARWQRCTGGSLLMPGIRTVANVRGDAPGEFVPDDPWWKWRLHACNRECGVLALPYVTRWADPSWLWWRLRCRWREREDRREGRRVRRAWRKAARLTRRMSD